MDDSDNLDLKKHIKATQQAGDDYLTATIYPFLKQFLFTIFLYVILWNQFSWIKWTLLFTVPASLYNIYKIYNQKKYLESKVAEMKGMVRELTKESCGQLE